MFSRIFAVAGVIFVATFAGSSPLHAQAQTPPPAQQPTQQPRTQPEAQQANDAPPALATGTVINAELDGSVDSKKAKVGDEVKARTTQEIKKDDKTVLPKGTKLVGHIVRSSARSKGDADSTLAIQFDRAILKHDQELPLEARIRAIAAPPVNVAASPDMMSSPGYSGGQSANSQTMAGNPNTRPNTGGAATAGVPVTGNPNAVVGGVDANGRPIVGEDSTGSVGGLTAQGKLAENSRGVFGLEGISLHAPANTAQPVVIASDGKNVHLDGGTRLLLVTQAPASAVISKANPQTSASASSNPEAGQPNQ